MKDYFMTSSPNSSGSSCCVYTLCQREDGAGWQRGGGALMLFYLHHQHVTQNHHTLVRPPFLGTRTHASGMGGGFGETRSSWPCRTQYLSDLPFISHSSHMNKTVMVLCRVPLAYRACARRGGAAPGDWVKKCRPRLRRSSAAARYGGPRSPGVGGLLATLPREVDGLTEAPFAFAVQALVDGALAELRAGDRESWGPGATGPGPGQSGSVTVRPCTGTHSQHADRAARVPGSTRRQVARCRTRCTAAPCFVLASPRPTQLPDISSWKPVSEAGSRAHNAGGSRAPAGARQPAAWVGSDAVAPTPQRMPGGGAGGGHGLPRGW